jgi:hypothetical protein
MVIARSAGNDSLACGAVTNTQQVNGKIAVVYRGDCEFGTKALNAQNAGAVGVIIVNNEAGNATIDMGAGVSGAAVTIPVVMVSSNVGLAINAALNSGSARVVLEQFNGGGMFICPEDPIRLAGPAGFDAYEWNTGDQTAVGEFTGGGTYTLNVYNEFGCSTASSSVVFNEFAVTQPVINESNGMLSSNTNAVVYQWYLNGEPIAGSTQNIPVQGSGSYTVEVTDANGCSSESDPYELTLVGINEATGNDFRIWPNPVQEFLNIELLGAKGFLFAEILGSDGRLILRKDVSNTSSLIHFDINNLAKGVYTLRLVSADSISSARFVKQ